MTDPEDTVITLINAVSGWTTNTNLFKGPVRATSSLIPQKSVFVTATGGPEPINFSPNSYTLQEFEHNVQVVIRGESEKYGTTKGLAETIYVALHDRAPAGWIFLRATNPAPVFVAKDEVGCPIFAINLRMGILE